MNLQGMPRFARIQAALRCTTEHLAKELAAPTEQAPRWNSFEWDVARAVATMQGTTVLLANRLRWRGPESWNGFLETQCQLARRRDALIESLLLRIDSALIRSLSPCVALKGSALRRLGLYQPAERPMGDVDLLAYPEHASAIEDTLRGLGYARAFETRRHLVYEPLEKSSDLRFGEHPGNPLKIEVHFRVAEPLPIRVVDITSGLRGNAQQFGLNPYASECELMRHLLLHAAGNMRAHALRQIQLHDIALLGSRLPSSAWTELLESHGSLGGSWWMWPVLALTQQYYPGHLPPTIGDFRARCPRLLSLAASRMTLTEVSWSNLRIAAFPGIEWSRSVRESLEFARSRIVPPRVALDDLAFIESAQPQMLQVPWYGIPHAKRILKWVFSRPPRVQTITSLCAAIEDPAREAA